MREGQALGAPLPCRLASPFFWVTPGLPLTPWRSRHQALKQLAGAEIRFPWGAPRQRVRILATTNPSRRFQLSRSSSSSSGPRDAMWRAAGAGKVPTRRAGAELPPGASRTHEGSSLSSTQHCDSGTSPFSFFKFFILPSGYVLH